MRNFFAAMFMLIAFTATVGFVNMQQAEPNVPLSFDIRDAAIYLGSYFEQLITAQQIDFPMASQAALGLGALGLTLPALFVFVLLGRIGR